MSHAEETTGNAGGWRSLLDMPVSDFKAGLDAGELGAVACLWFLVNSWRSIGIGGNRQLTKAY